MNTIPMNTSSEPDSLSRELFRAMNSREFSAFENVITENVAFDFPGVGRTEGRRRSALLLKSILRKYPKLRFDVQEIIAKGDRACVVWTNQGEDTNGRPYSNRGITLLHFSEGRIAFISDYFKDTSFTEGTT
jgi:ketosteroid isomerase-like protein